MADDTITAETHRESTGTAQELFLSLLWLGTTLYVAYASLGQAPTPGGALGAAREAMPDLILSSLVAGASLGAAAGSRFRGPGGRLLAGPGIGFAFGLVAAVAMRMVYGTQPPITVLALTVGLTTIVGGAVAILPAEIVGGGLWAMTWVAFLGVMFPVWLLGLGDDSFLADTRLQAVVKGVVGLYALQHLRGERHPWYWYPLAGALPGLLLLIAELLTRFGGSVLTNLIHGAASGSQPLLAPSAERLQVAVIVLAVGGAVCVVASIRTLARSPEPAED
ncbi:MAG: hypothetical protein ACM30G_16450 [Micromonosporaceae bacterium]